MITVCIPTIWAKPEYLQRSIELLNKSVLITQIILINNDRSYNYRHLSSILTSTKVEIIIPSTNMYVSASWNYGVKNSVNETVCLLNDDILVDVESLYKILPNAYGLVGINEKSFKHVGTPIIRPAYVRPLGFGQLMFVKRSRYPIIPEDIRIWYNDDYLFERTPGQHYEITCSITGYMSSSTFSRPEFEIIKQQDAAAYLRYKHEYCFTH